MYNTYNPSNKQFVLIMRKLKKIQIAIVVIVVVALVNLRMSLQVDFGFVEQEDIDWLKIQTNHTIKNNSIANEKGIRKQHQAAYEIIQEMEQPQQTADTKFNKSDNPSNENEKLKTAKTFNLPLSQQSEVINVEKIQQIRLSKLTPKERLQLTKQRIQMGEPHLQEREIGAWVISGKHRSSNCAIFNSLTLLTNVSISTAKVLLDGLSFGHSIFLVDHRDNIAHNLTQQQFDSSAAQYHPIRLDSQYKFIRVLVSAFGCQTIMYLNHNFKLLLSQSHIIEASLQKCSNLQVCYTSRIAQQSQTQQVNLPALASVNLELLTASQHSSYIFMFRSQYFGLVSPLNFAYYARYTIEQILILPVLAIAQKLGKLVPIHDPIHQIASPYAHSAKNYRMQHNITQPGVNQFCFVSYPSNPQEQSYTDLKRYLQSIESLNKANASVSMLLYLPYRHNQKQSSDFLKIVHQVGLMKQAKIRVQIVHRINRTVSSVSVYESAHSLCRPDAVIVASRHNVKYHPQFLQQIIKKVSHNSNLRYYFVSFKNQDGKNVKLAQTQLQSMNESRQVLLQLYQSHFYAVQVFKSQLIKTINIFWSLRPTDFYESELSFVLPLLEYHATDVQIIEQQMMTVYNRQINSAEKEQMQDIVKLSKSLPSTSTPALYQTGLTNEGFRKNKSPSIPRILHIFQQNQQTFEKLKPSFKTMIWKSINISAQNFPLTYTFVSRRMLQMQQPNSCRFLKRILAYEIIYQHGGIYLEQSSYAGKKLQKLLPFNIFFNTLTNCPNQSLNKACIQFDESIFGATQHNYHIKIFLTQIISQSPASDESIGHSDQQLFRMQQIFNAHQLATEVAFGPHISNAGQQSQHVVCFGV